MGNKLRHEGDEVRIKVIWPDIYRTNSLGLSTNITTRSWGFEKMKKHGEMTDKQVGIPGITGPF